MFAPKPKEEAPVAAPVAAAGLLPNENDVPVEGVPAAVEAPKLSPEPNELVAPAFEVVFAGGLDDPPNENPPAGLAVCVAPLEAPPNEKPVLVPPVVVDVPPPKENPPGLAVFGSLDDL